MKQFLVNFGGLFKTSSLWLGLILALGIWLRLDNLDQKIWLYSGLDSARDILVSKHIVEYGETIQKGPYVAGGYNWLQNSPVYYYFLATLWYFSKSIFGITLLWSIILSSGIVLIFWAGKLTRDSTTGLIAATIYAIHPELILETSQIFQPHLLPLFGLISYICLLKAYQQKSGIYLAAGTVAILLPIHLHYSIGLLLPIFGLAIIYLVIKMIQNRWKNWGKHLILIALAVTTICLGWILMTYQIKPLDQFEIFQLNKNSYRLPFAQKLGIILQTLRQVLLGYVSTINLIFIWLSAIVLVWLTQNQLSPKKLNIWFWFLSGLFFSSSLVLLFNDRILASYFIGLIPFFIIFWAICVRSLWRLDWFLGLIGLLFIFNWSYQQSFFSLAKTAPEFGFATHFTAGTKAIYQDYQKLTIQSNIQPEFIVAALSTSIPEITNDSWLTSIYWLYLEDLFKKPLVKLTDYAVNFEPLQEKPKYIYFACQHYSKPELEQEACYKPFIRARNNINIGRQIFKDEVQTIWQFSVKAGQEFQSANRFY